MNDLLIFFVEYLIFICLKNFILIFYLKSINKKIYLNKNVYVIYWENGLFDFI